MTRPKVSGSPLAGDKRAIPKLGPAGVEGKGGISFEGVHCAAKTKMAKIGSKGSMIL
jgi:hypothetical protein